MNKLAMAIIAAGALAAAASSAAEHDHAHEHGREHEDAAEHDHAHEHGREHEDAAEHEDAHEHGHDLEHALALEQDCAHADKRGEFVTVSDAGIKSMGLTTARPRIFNLRSLASIYGRIECASDARTVASAPVKGRLKLNVREFASVKKGDALFTVESADLRTLDNEIAVMETRLKSLREIGAANAELESNLKVKKESRNALVAGAEAQGGVVTVRAAGDAVVERARAMSGEWAEAGAAILTLVDPAMICFRATIPSSNAAELKDGMAASVNGVQGTLRLGVGDGAGLTPVTVEFERGKIAAKPGASAKAEVELATGAGGEPVIALPNDAVVAFGAEMIVFARDKEDRNLFCALKVEKGMTSGDYVEVLGLPGNAEDLDVVVNGAYELKLALAAKLGSGAAAGHFHADGKFHEGDEH